MSAEPLLQVENLTTHFHTDEGTVRAVDGVSFDIRRGETVCLVGESGSGKSVTSESITRIVDIPPGEIVEGSVRFDGEELTEISEKRLRKIRGKRIAHVFQNPQDALNPVYTVGTQIAEVMKIHKTEQGETARRRRAVDLLDRVGIPDPAARVNNYPHEMSGGMKQRVVIAMALAAKPDLLIADEPTTALDVTIQAQILDLLEDLQNEFDMSVLFVTHDLGVVAQIADRVVVMYAGKVMERAGVYELFDNPGHPYTRALLACLPGEGDAETIRGELPSALDPPDGCRFAARCPYAVDDCTSADQPELVPVDGNAEQVASCLFHQPGYDRSHIDREVDWEAGSGAAAADGGVPGGDRTPGGPGPEIDTEAGGDRS